MKSKEKYIPPYKVSEEAVNLIAEISAAVERFDIAGAQDQGDGHVQTRRQGHLRAQRRRARLRRHPLRPQKYISHTVSSVTPK